MRRGGTAFGAAGDDRVHEVAPDLAYQRLAIVNVAFYGPFGAGDRGWVLIDAGLPGTAGRIAEAAAERFGEGSRPAAIILTHGHFDHVGALHTLTERYDAPVYAHPLEFPYLDGRSPYPPPDPTVGGGLMARLSAVYPRGPIDVSRSLKALPESGDVPEMPGWRWLHTPGHTPGHVSLWRDADRLLVAGDAFVTTKQESAYAVAVQKPMVSGPPRYYTPDWGAAKTSVRTLAALSPERVVTGHGRAMGGPKLRGALERLARDFERLAVPERGRYVGRPALADASGTRYVPPKPSQSGLGAVALGALMTLAGGWLVYRGVSRREVGRRGRTRGRAAPETPALDVTRSITVGGSADELYRQWLDPRTLAQVMGHFAEVTALGDDRIRWRVHAPLGRRLEWDTQVVDRQPGERIRWRTLEGAALPNEGTVEFRAAPDDWGTVVTLHLRFDPPGGALGAAAAKLFEAPVETLVGKALRRFKSFVETGEIPSLERNPSGRGRGDAV